MEDPIIYEKCSSKYNGYAAECHIDGIYDKMQNKILSIMQEKLGLLNENLS